MAKGWRVRKRFLLIPLALLIVGCVVFAFFSVYGHSRYAQPAGRLVMGDNQAYDDAIKRYCESWDLGAICRAYVLGHDDRYIYAQLFRTGGGAAQAYDEARYAYTTHPLSITGQVLVGEDNRHPSVEEIYPEAIYKVDREVWFYWAL